MLISTSYSQAFSKTHSSFRSRKRVQSLKPLQPKGNDREFSTQQKNRQIKLEKCLQRDLKRCSYLLTEPDQSIPDSSHHRVQNKLWPYFKHRMQLVRDKVVIEQANECSRQFYAIRQLVNKRKQGHAKNIERLTKLSKDKYREIHQRFEEIKRSNMNKLMLNISNKKNKRWEPIDNKDQVRSLKEDVEFIRMELLKIENQLKNQKNSLGVLTSQWIALLKCIVKNGYFLNDGISPILSEMAKYQYVPQHKDFPQYIDNGSFKYILNTYNKLKSKRKQDSKSKKFRISRAKSTSIKTIAQIAEQPQLKHIYQGTRDYMIHWVKNGIWKQQTYTPKLNNQQTDIVSDEAQVQQRRRIPIVYTDSNIREQVKYILFGPKVESAL